MDQGSQTLQTNQPVTLLDVLREAKLLHRTGKLPAAEPLYLQVLAHEPLNPDALHYLGLLSYQTGRTPAAIDLMYRALAVRPDLPEFNNNLGMVLVQASRPADALKVLDRAIEINPDYTEAFHNRGDALKRLDRMDEAISSWRRAIALKPDYAESHQHLGNALLARNEAAAAADHFRKAVAAIPTFAEGFNSLGCALRALGDLEGAAVAYRQAGELLPRYAEAHNNLGTTLYEMGRPHEGIPHLEKAIDLRPDYPDGHWNLACCLLACGDLERGFPEYEWRRNIEVYKKDQRNFVQPEWNGCSLTGRTILVTSEQGLGDSIQFVRYAPLLARRGAKVVFECLPAVCQVLGGVEGIAQLVARGQPLPRFDTHVRMLSLPAVFGTKLGNIPAEIPYLHADPLRIQQWKARLGDGFKIGIAWQGSKAFGADSTRSIPLKEFEPLAKVPGVRLLNLQTGFGAEQIEALKGRFPVEVLEPALDQAAGAFVDTAAVMTHLDLVITCDTSIGHLAGALGTRVWVALSTGSDWRWMREREDSPWYPTMRLFRQRTARDWADVFTRMADALREMTSAPKATPAGPLLAPMAPGELIDRLTILQIKSQRVSDPVKLRNVRIELEVMSAVRDRTVPQSQQLDALTAELHHVNEALWQIEDDIRAADHAGDFGPKFVELARSVYRTNDRRADLKKRINALLGSTIVDEKSYKPYGA